MFSLIIYEFTCIDKKTLDHHGAPKGEEKAASMSQMTEMMASIQNMLLERQPQLSQLTKELNEIKESQQQQIAQLNKKIESKKSKRVKIS